MTYGLVAIVKDEAERIGRLIESVRPHISAYTIIDTGSSDDTPARIRSGLAGIGGLLVRSTFKGFGPSRSEALAAARGTADWLLCLDADMTVEIDADFVPDPKIEAYLVRMGSADGFSWPLPLLLRGDLAWRSVGMVHEYTALVDDRPYVAIETDKVRIRYEDRSSPGKSAWHAELLEADLAANPENARATYYLAQTYRDLGRTDEARALFERRAEMGGFAEEAFWAAYQGATLVPDLDARVAALIRAWERRPHRMEPLYEAARALNAEGRHALADKLLANPAPYPRNEQLFVEGFVWAWGLDFERSIAAWWVGRRDECRDLCDALLERPLPGHIRAQVEANRRCCE